MPGASEGGAGVAFWANDPSNYYAAAIYRDGGYAVFRKVNGVVRYSRGDTVNGFGRLAPAERNVPRLVLLDPAGRELYPQWHAVAAQTPAAPEQTIVVYTPEGEEAREKVALLRARRQRQRPSPTARQCPC